MFVGRMDLISFARDLIEVRGGARIPADVFPRPLLVLEGRGGSGRAGVLRAIWDDWAGRAPTAWVDPLVADDEDTGTVRPLLAAMMLGLSSEAVGYRVSFPRVVLAEIAIHEPVREVDPEAAVEVMRLRLNTYRDRGRVTALVGDLVIAAGDAVRDSGLPAGEVIAPPVAKALSETMVSRLHHSSLMAKLNWSDALAWFAHQDQGLRHHPERALVRLSVQARSTNPAVRAEVDDLLITAFLADLREAFSAVPDHPFNAVVLLDHADAPTTVDFLTALVRVRRDLAQAGTPMQADPLVVVAASGGVLVGELDGVADRKKALAESVVADLDADDVRRAGALLVVSIDDLTPQDVRSLAKALQWPAELGLSVVADSVHRLTQGHADATALVLRALEAAPELVDQPHTILSSTAASGSTVESRLLDGFLAALSPHRRVDESSRDWLITLSAARDQDEARRLGILLDAPATAGPLLSAVTLWSSPGPRGGSALAPFVRYLGLRALALRGADHPASWRKVFEALRSNAVADLAGRLHHDFALGRLASTAVELADLLPRTPAGEWLALLDQMVATPHPAGAAVGEVPATMSAPATVVVRLLEALHLLADPGGLDRGKQRLRLGLIDDDYRLLAAHSTDRAEFIGRAQRYRALAEELS
jgi:hypothetical protein